MKKKCLAAAECPLSRGYNAIGDWWSLLIITRVLLLGMHRFSQIQEDLGMARNILSTRLAKLVEEGILEKVPASDGSAYQEYAATGRGKDLYKTIVALRQWGEQHFCKEANPEFSLVDKKKGKLVPALEVRAADGRVLQVEDLEIRDLRKKSAT